MASKNIILALEKELFEKAQEKSKKEGYKSVQQYVYELIRKDLFRKKAGGRPKILSSEEKYLNKFSTPTKETKRIEKLIRGGRI